MTATVRSVFLGVLIILACMAILRQFEQGHVSGELLAVSDGGIEESTARPVAQNRDCGIGVGNRGDIGFHDHRLSQFMEFEWPEETEDNNGIIVPKVVTLVQRERYLGTEDAPLEGRWKYSASFEILHISAVGLDDYLVMGKGRGDEKIVERWRLSPVKGALTSNGSSVVVHGGGEYVPPGSRRIADLDRESIVLPDSDNLVSLDADSSGKYAYMLFCDRDTKLGEIYRKALYDLSPAVMIRDVTHVPNLWMADTLDFWGVHGGGELVVASCNGLVDVPGSGVQLVRERYCFEDMDEDGFFESDLTFVTEHDFYTHYHSVLKSKSGLFD